MVVILFSRYTLPGNPRVPVAGGRGEKQAVSEHIGSLSGGRFTLRLSES